MARDTKGKGKEIQEVHYDEAQSSHPAEQSLIEPFPVAPKATTTEDNPRPNQVDVDGTKSTRADVLPSDPLGVQIKDILILANDSGDGDALRRAAILNAQFQAVVHASNVPSLYNMDGAHSEDSGYQTNESEYSSPERPPSIESQAASRAPLVDHKSGLNEAERPVSNVSASLNDDISKISRVEIATLPGARPPGDDREGPSIWEYLSGFCCCKIWAMLLFRRPTARQDTRQQIEGSDAAQKGKVKEDGQTAKKVKRKSKEAERTVNQGEGAAKSDREQCQRSKVTVQEAQEAEKLQNRNGKKTGRLTERRQRAYSTSTMLDFNNSLYPHGVGPFQLARRPTLSRNTTPDS